MKKINLTKREIFLFVLLICTIVVSYAYISYKRISYFNEGNTSSIEFLQKIRKLHPLAGKIPRTEGKHRALIVNSGRFGEARVALRWGKILNNLGYEWAICDEESINLADKMNPDFILSLRPEIPPQKGCENFLFILMENDFSSPNVWSHAAEYENFLNLGCRLNAFKKYLADKKKNIKIMPLNILAVEKTEFCDSQKKKLFYGGCILDDERGVRYRKLYQLLDKAGYFEAYGPPRTWTKLSLSSYKGLLPWRFEKDDVVDAIRRNGVALVLHGRESFENGVITSRIFESAAASAVIISDKQQFVKKNFGDSVLYIDVTKSPGEIFQQIDAHMQWILKNPEKAIELAKRSHKIFVDNFTLEKEVDKIKEFYDQIVAEKKGQKAL